eukprot:CAMPEP_0206245660 /NCGR_PEP_ID=MMETSP0047_2-20121206/18817_1 /ASSEMBLY_ACC=CAM_ASM_000192 /TAXON_ID=195065 /ORGANISM="Chroomonas mesostigmatica_cf, Strain CCMP1168" /LENGTH=333 /DNA_ID=CAMNT_0053670977 /DNA_START=53 /DNA_END=1052 /DNA_ORIENTATION=-
MGLVSKGFNAMGPLPVQVFVAMGLCCAGSYGILQATVKDHKFRSATPEWKAQAATMPAPLKDPEGKLRKRAAGGAPGCLLVWAARVLACLCTDGWAGGGLVEKAGGRSMVKGSSSSNSSLGRLGAPRFARASLPCAQMPSTLPQPQPTNVLPRALRGAGDAPGAESRGVDDGKPGGLHPRLDSARYLRTRSRCNETKRNGGGGGCKRLMLKWPCTHRGLMESAARRLGCMYRMARDEALDRARRLLSERLSDRRIIQHGYGNGPTVSTYSLVEVLVVAVVGTRRTVLCSHHEKVRFWPACCLRSRSKLGSSVTVDQTCCATSFAPACNRNSLQ